MRILMLCLLPVLLVATVAVSQNSEDHEVDRAVSLARQGRIDEAIAVMKPVVAKAGVSVNARALLGRLLDFDGRPKEALEVWKQGLTRTADDVQLLEEMVDVYERQSNDGPFVEHRRGQVVYHPTRGRDKEVEAFKKERLALALECRRELLRLRPDAHDYRVAVGRLLERAERFDEALALYTEWAAHEKSSPEFLLGQARMLEKVGRDKEATSIYRRITADHPQLDAAWKALARRLEAEGEAKAAAEADRRARFYDWVPDCLDIPFTEENERILVLLYPPKQKIEEDRKATIAAREKEIRRLIREPDASCSTPFLTALCYHHSDHGELEDAIFAALAERGADGVYHLKVLLSRGQSMCTLRSAAWNLARLKAPDILPRLLRLLDADTRPMWHMNIAGALAELGNREAVPALVHVMAVELQQDRSDPMFHLGRGGGRLKARHRAALALGVLGGAEAVAALEKGTSNPDLRFVCLVGFYRATGKKEVLEQLARTTAEERRAASVGVPRAYFDAVDPAAWPKLAGAWGLEDEENK